MFIFGLIEGREVCDTDVERDGLKRRRRSGCILILQYTAVKCISHECDYRAQMRAISIVSRSLNNWSVRQDVRVRRLMAH